MSLPAKRRDVYHGRLHTSSHLLAPASRRVSWPQLFWFMLIATAAITWALRQP